MGRSSSDHNLSARGFAAIVEASVDLSFSRSGAGLWFHLFADRYERRSLLINSNLPFDKWGRVFQGERMTAAFMDRLTHQCEIRELTDESDRFWESMPAKRAKAGRTTKLSMAKKCPHSPPLQWTWIRCESPTRDVASKIQFGSPTRMNAAQYLGWANGLSPGFSTFGMSPTMTAFFSPRLARTTPSRN